MALYFFNSFLPLDMSTKLTSSIFSDTPLVVRKQPEQPDTSYFTHQRLRYAIAGTCVNGIIIFRVSVLISCFRWHRMPFISSKPPEPPKKSLDDACIIPEATAGFFSLITFGWMTPLLCLGYARQLEATDLYKLQSERGAAYMANKIIKSFAQQVEIANEYNDKLANGKIKPGLRALWWTVQGKREAQEKRWRNETGRKKASIVWAMNNSVKWLFWSAGLLKVVGDAAQLTSPLLAKVRFYVPCSIIL